MFRKEDVEALRKWLGRQGVHYFSVLLRLCKNVSPNLKLNAAKRHMPTWPTYLREGMSIRNWLRDRGFRSVDPDWFNTAWKEIVTLAVFEGWMNIPKKTEKDKEPVEAIKESVGSKTYTEILSQWSARKLWIEVAQLAGIEATMQNFAYFEGLQAYYIEIERDGKRTLRTAPNYLRDINAITSLCGSLGFQLSTSDRWSVQEKRLVKSWLLWVDNKVYANIDERRYTNSTQCRFICEALLLAVYTKLKRGQNIQEVPKPEYIIKGGDVSIATALASIEFGFMSLKMKAFMDQTAANNKAMLVKLKELFILDAVAHKRGILLQDLTKLFGIRSEVMYDLIHRQLLEIVEWQPGSQNVVLTNDGSREWIARTYSGENK